MNACSPTVEADRQPLPLLAKGRLVLRIWLAFLLVQIRLQREPLPELIARLRDPGRPDRRRYPPARLSRAVHKSLRLGERRPRCLVTALVLFRLLREQGDPAELVIGLPPDAPNHEAHAWVELRGADVGPPPGRGNHSAMARFG